MIAGQVDLRALLTLRTHLPFIGNDSDDVVSGFLSGLAGEHEAFSDPILSAEERPHERLINIGDSGLSGRDVLTCEGPSAQEAQAERFEVSIAAASPVGHGCTARLVRRFWKLKRALVHGLHRQRISN